MKLYSITILLPVIQLSLPSYCMDPKLSLLRREPAGVMIANATGIVQSLVGGQAEVALMTAGSGLDRDNTTDRMAKPRIPRQLILTGPVDSLQEMGAFVQQKVQNLLSRDPDMKVRWFGDKLCAQYISQHIGKKLLSFFEHEPRGALRGDMCRTAVLFREGGYYIDLDVDLRAPLHKLVDKSTSFMSVFEDFDDKQGPNGGILNALMAAEPGSPVLKQTLTHIRKWYQRGRFGPRKYSMGPLTLSTALSQVMHQDCPSEWKKQLGFETGNPASKWQCASHTFQFYAQRRLHCTEKHDYGPEVCTAARLNASGSWKNWLDYGIFTLGHGRERQLIAFPHAEWCEELGCGLGGHSVDENRSLEPDGKRIDLNVKR